MGFLNVGIVFCLLLSIAHASSEQGGVFTFNVLRYGAVADGTTDNSKAFLRAWTNACQWRGSSGVLIPRGSYMLDQVIFKGPCQGPIEFHIDGDVKAYQGMLDAETWINFRYVDQLHLTGSGTIDGQGAVAWSYNTCSQNSRCRKLPVSLGFDFVTNSTVDGIKSLNSKNTHINVFACANLSLTNMAITAPRTSPNTDGIRIGSSTDILLSRLKIGTGDDCVSLLPGSKGIRISDVACGPGHGISIGSLGKNKGEKDVTGLRVSNCTFVGTENGLRIKTWAASQGTSLVRDMIFEDIEMKNVANPIIIDQHYCPHRTCLQLQETESQVRISDILFKNIWGVSASKAAVNLQCSARVPCQKINFQDINLAYDGKGGPVTSQCNHASGFASGYLRPRPCV